MNDGCSDAPRPWTENLLQLDPPALNGSRCGCCGRSSFPAREVCPRCHAVDCQEQVTLDTHGTLFTYTVIRQAPPGVDVPYVLGYVDLAAEDIRVLSRVSGLDPAHLSLGMQLQLKLVEFGRDSRGPLMGWEFVPASERGTSTP